MLLFLQALGCIVNQEKSHLSPAQELKFLGVFISGLITESPAHTTRQEDKTNSQRGSTPASEGVSSTVFSIPGKLYAASQAMLVAPTFYPALQRNLQTALTHGA